MAVFMGVLFGIAFIAAGVFLITHGHLYIGLFCIVCASMFEIRAGKSRIGS